MDCFGTCHGSQTPRSPSAPHQTGLEDVAFGPSDGLGTPVETFRGSIARPMPAACQRFTASRRPAHGSRRKWLVVLSFCRDFHPATFHQFAWRTRGCFHAMSCDAAMAQTCHHRPNSVTAPRFAVLSK